MAIYIKSKTNCSSSLHSSNTINPNYICPPKSNKRQRPDEAITHKSPPNSQFKTGRWMTSENELFKQGIQLFGPNWEKLQTYIKTRSASQIQNHAQKYTIGQQDYTPIHKMASEGPYEFQPCSKTNSTNSTDSHFDSNAGNNVLPAKQLLTESLQCMSRIIHSLAEIKETNKHLSVIHLLVQQINRGNERIFALANECKPLEPSELKGIASLKIDIEEILRWYGGLKQIHMEFSSLKYVYENVVSDVIDIYKFNFLSLIKRSPPPQICSYGGFSKYNRKEEGGDMKCMN